MGREGRFPILDPSSPVTELSSSLHRQRLSREVTLALRTGLRDAKAEFSFLRVKGLRNILKFIQSLSESDAAIRLFLETQSLSELKVIPVLFEHTLARPKEVRVVNFDHIYSVEPLQITSPATDTEVALALRVLEGCCLLSKENKSLAHKHGAIKVLLQILSTGSDHVQGPCLDAIIALMLDSPGNQMEFDAGQGIEKIAELLKHSQVDENLRLKCGEFLLLLVGHVLPSTNQSSAPLEGRAVVANPPLASVEEDLRRLLGEKCASLIWAASQFGSTLDMEQRQTALHIHARRVLNSMELNSDWN